MVLDFLSSCRGLGGLANRYRTLVFSRLSQKMDSRKIVEFLKGTIDPNQRAAAEEQLKEVRIYTALHTVKPKVEF